MIRKIFDSNNDAKRFLSFYLNFGATTKDLAKIFLLENETNITSCKRFPLMKESYLIYNA